MHSRPCVGGIGGSRAATQGADRVWPGSEPIKIKKKRRAPPRACGGGKNGILEEPVSNFSVVIRAEDPVTES